MEAVKASTSHGDQSGFEAPNGKDIARERRRVGAAGPPSSTSIIGTEGRFNLLELPAEIRLEIVKHVLVHHEDIKIPKITTGPLASDISYPSVAILQTCKKINTEGTEVLYKNNKFTICLPMDPTSSPDTPFKQGPSFLLSKFRWSTIPLISHLSFVSNSESLPGLTLSRAYTRPSFSCSGADIMARFTPHDQRYSPGGPDEYMALSVSNWVSTKVMRAELSAFQSELEAMMRPSDAYAQAMADDPAT